MSDDHMKLSWDELNALINEALSLEQDIRGTARLRQMEIVRTIRAGALDYNAQDASYDDAMTADMIVATHGDSGRYYSADMETHEAETIDFCTRCPREVGCPCDRLARAEKSRSRTIGA